MNAADHYLTRYLEAKDLDQYNALLRYTFQVTEEELTATGWKDDEIKQSKFPVLERADVLGCFDGDTLVSQFAVYPLKMNIYDTVYHVGFVTSVCTYPEYTGNGVLVLEPTYRHILLIDLADWNGSIVLDDGLFLACDSKLKQKAVMRSNFSSAVAGGEGLFNLGVVGNGVLCLESPSPKEELIEVTLQDDVLKVDGNMAIAWSGTLDFTVERSGKTLLGSAASGEGLVNVYRGTGKVLLAPVGGNC